jgi:hypothetical protein
MQNKYYYINQQALIYIVTLSAIHDSKNCTKTTI